MKFRVSRFYLLIPFSVLALSQIMCNTVMNEEETIKLAEELVGLIVGEGLDYDVDVELIGLELIDEIAIEWCRGYKITPANSIESFEWGKHNEWTTLTVISSGGRLVYTEDGDGNFCRKVYPDGEECIRWLGPKSYSLTFDVLTDGWVIDRPRIHCYHAIHNLTLIEPEMPGGEVVQDESAPPPDENVADDPSTDPKPEEEASQPNGSACDATQYLQVTSEITRQKTNQFGTRSCEYTLKIYNTNDDIAVWFYIYQHEKDGFQHTEKSMWMGNFPIDPDKEFEWFGNISIYTDKDADGPVMSIPEKLAGVFGSPECAEAKQDEKFLEQIAVSINPVCPME